MNYIECPDNTTEKQKAVFLAGGITNCPDWQKELAFLLQDTDLTLINPRRKNFDVSKPEMTDEQIRWEHKYLVQADTTSFWFPEETLCPITLFELGKLAALGKTIFVGVHPGYQRKVDVEIQLELIRPEIKIVYSLEDLALQLKMHFGNDLVPQLKEMCRQKGFQYRTAAGPQMFFEGRTYEMKCRVFKTKDVDAMVEDTFQYMDLFDHDVLCYQMHYYTDQGTTICMRTFPSGKDPLIV